MWGANHLAGAARLRPGGEGVRQPVYISLCSGVGGLDLFAKSLGWRCAYLKKKKIGQSWQLATVDGGQSGPEFQG